MERRPFRRNFTQTLFLHKNQQTQPSILHESQLLVRRMLVLFWISTTLLRSLMFHCLLEQRKSCYLTVEGKQERILLANQLSSDSKPWEIVETQWSNIKCMLTCAGSIIFTENCKPLTTEEFRQHFCIYVLVQVLVLSSYLEYKFNPQQHNLIGKWYGLHCIQFKCRA